MENTSPMTPGPRLTEELVELRHDLHRHPELGTHLPRTQARVLELVGALEGLEVTAGTRQSSVTVVLRGGAPCAGERPVVLLRGDMDGLPVTENAPVDYASEEPGMMHACGHDVHTSALYGALRMLHERRAELVADVVFMFQPAEEASVGAAWMMEDGVLDAAGRRPDAAFGLHVFSGVVPHGVFATLPGVFMAGCEDLVITVEGQGGHGSLPHLAKDPVLVACEIALALQTHANNRYDPFEPLVLTVGSIQGGTDSVVIPDHAELKVSVRVLSEATRERVREEIPVLVERMAQAHGLGAEVEFRPSYPPLLNDPRETAYMLGLLEERFGADAVRQLEHPMLGSEDFAWVLREVPGSYVILGAQIPGAPDETNHSPGATYDDAMVPRAAEALALLAWERGRGVAG